MMKKQGRVYFCIGALFLVLLASPGIAQQPLIQPIGNGEVNWATQVISATGSGAPNPQAPNIAAARLGAERAAKADALRNILETIKGVRIDSQTLVVNAMTESDVIRTQVQGVVQGARVVNTRYLSDGAVEVTVEVPMAGPLTQTLLPPASFGTQPVPKAGNPVYTGIVFDSRGLNLRPAMAPKVLDEDGREVYGSAFVSQEWATKYGIVGYVKDPDAARQNDRVTNNPLFVKAVKATGAGSSDIVISNADAQGLRDMSKNLSFLEQCRVLVVVD
jgi:hypothetical protein